MTTRTLTVEAREAPARLDAYVGAVTPSLSRRLVRDLIAAGEVRVNGRRAPKGAVLRAGDRVTLPELPATLAPEPELALEIVHEDATVAALVKPGGMPAHALDPRQRGTAAGFVLARWPETARVGDPLAPGLVHRLDTGTSGLLLVARTAEAHAILRAAFHAHQVEKRYHAVVAGVPTWQSMRTDLALAHDPRDRRRMVPAPPATRAWPATTAVRVLAHTTDRALVEAAIRTGVTHQVRVHLAELGHPVLNDTLYGGPSIDTLPPTRHALHASHLRLTHPTEGGVLDLRSELPGDLAALAPPGAGSV